MPLAKEYQKVGRWQVFCRNVARWQDYSLLRAFAGCSARASPARLHRKRIYSGLY